MVCTRDDDPIPGALRHQWMCEQHPGLDVRHVTDVVPQEPAEHPEFWRIWRELCQREAGEPVEAVFASEAYGARLAEELGATWFPVDPSRHMVPVSGTALRADPMRYWDYLIPPARPYFLKRVCVFGPESTGKSTLAADLAAHYGTVHVAEWARTWLDPRGGRCEPSDVPIIGLGQRAAEDALARQARRVLFCDTDALTTTIWSDWLTGDCPPELRREARERRYDLTLLLDVDVPWVDDTQRFLPDQREAFFARCEAALVAHQRPYRIIRGDWEARRSQAIQAVDALLASPVTAPGK